jgi:hypothetical protein
VGVHSRQEARWSQHRPPFRLATVPDGAAVAVAFALLLVSTPSSATAAGGTRAPGGAGTTGSVDRPSSGTGSGPAITSYVAQFNATGLPSSASWWLDLAGTNRSASGASPIQFALGNGTYPFTVGASLPAEPTPGAGRLLVAGADQYVSVQFALPAPLYAITFSESGLPPNTQWTVTFAGIARTTVAGPPLVYHIANGSYAYAISTNANYVATPAAGSITVDGGPVTVTARFVAFAPSSPPPPNGPISAEALAAAAAGAAGVIGLVGWWLHRSAAARRRDGGRGERTTSRRRRTGRGGSSRSSTDDERDETPGLVAGRASRSDAGDEDPGDRGSRDRL